MPSSSEITGAPSGAPLASAAEAAAELARLSTAEEVRAFIDRVAEMQATTAAERTAGRRAQTVVRLRADRRWGELLGPAGNRGTPGNQNARNGVTPRNTVSGAERAAIARARAIAPRVISDEKFDEYVATTAKPTYKGLVALHGATPTPRPQRRTEPQERREPRAQSRRGPTEGGRRLRQLQADRREIGESELDELQQKVSRAVRALEGVEVAERVAFSEETQESIRELCSDLEVLRRWTERAIAVVGAARGDLDRENRLQLLRARASDPSSAQQERETAAELCERERRRAS